MTTKTLPELIAAAKRELALRRNVYPGWIDRGKLKPEKAEHEIDCMAGIVEALEAVATAQEPGQNAEVIAALAEWIELAEQLAIMQCSPNAVTQQRVHVLRGELDTVKKRAVGAGFLWPTD